MNLMSMISGVLGFASSKQQGWYNFADTESGVTEIRIYDDIGWYGVTAKDFIAELDRVNTDEILLRVNSPGGSVFDGFAIYNALKRHDAKVTVVVDGVAASIASIIALAGDEIHIVDNGIFMIHKAWNIIAGNADELRKSADILDKIDGNILDVYVSKTGLETAQIDNWVAEETFFTAEEAQEHGFVDQVIEPSKSGYASLNLENYQNVPSKIKAIVNGEKPDAPKEEEEKEPQVTCAHILAQARLRIAEAESLATE